MKTTLLFIVTLLCCELFAQQAEQIQLTNQEKLTLFKVIEHDSVFATWVRDSSNAIILYKQYKTNVMQSDSTWKSDQKRLKKIEDFGYTNKFELIPLVEHLSGNAAFKKGEGVSYLIRTDNSTILFDTGIDDDSLRCVLRYNLEILGIDISEIDMLFISHNHEDHQNEWKWINDKTFVNTENKNILPDIKVYVPDDKIDLKIAKVFSSDPVKISEGVYTTGIIKAPMFFFSTQEQGLMFNVKDKGIIIVTGCGHQTVEKILQRHEKLSNIPLYGILGGLHFPIDGDSEKYMSYFITNKLPWEAFTLSDVDKRIELLKKQNIKLISVSTHDSSGKTIESFKKDFSKEYQDLRTGKWIVVK